MKNKQDNQYRKIIPSGENKCIWMEAGYIAFKLCPFGYDCAHCSLDLAMRTAHANRRGNDGVVPTLPINPSKAKEVTLTLSQQLLTEFPPFHQQIKPNLFYHPRFSWLDLKDEKTGRLGIDPFLIQLLGNIHVIVMPLPQSRIHQGEYYCWLFGDYPPMPLVSPVNGIVNYINEQVRQEPETLVTQKDTYTWLAEVSIDDFQKDKRNLMDAQSAQLRREEQIAVLKKQFEPVLESYHSSTGLTLPDGGTRLVHILDILGKKQYYDIIFRFLRKINL